jgi:putative phage-type endonuclease
MDMSRIEQRSPEWFSARLGKVTASRVADVIAKTKSGYSTSRANYMAELIVERLTGKAAEHYQNAAMFWGTNTEPLALSSYEDRTGGLVEEVGFVPHPTIPWSGASPDGLVNEDGLVEIKCPNTSTHIETVLGQEVPAKYLPQMQWQMACTGRDYCDFVSFDPRLPDNMKIFVRTVRRDAEMIKNLEEEVSKFLAEIEAKIEQLKKLTGEE